MQTVQLVRRSLAHVKSQSNDAPEPNGNANANRRGLDRWFPVEEVMTNRTFRAAISACFALTVSFSAWADFTGKVVVVADGDSITVLRNRKQVKVRVADIDAPEKAQPFGNRSKQALGT